MKKYLALIVGVLLVLAMASGVYAETKFTMYGDARVRGTWQNNYNFNEDVDADKRWWDYRIRLGVKAVADGGTTVDTRLSLTNWNETWGSITPADSGTSVNTAVQLDYAHITVPLGKNFDATLGKVVVSWGKGFMAWDKRAYRLIVGTKFGDTVVKAFTQKSLEHTSGTAHDPQNLDDNDAYAILAIHKTKNLEIGGIYVYSVNNWSVTGTSYSPFLAGNNVSYTKTFVDKNGSQFNVYFHYKPTNMNIFGELEYRTGGAFEQTSAGGSTKDPIGGFLHVDYTTGPITLIGAVAFTSNGYVADNDFTPTFFYGTSQSTGMINFGQLGDTTAGLLAVSYAATKELSLMGKVAFASIDAFKAGEKNFDLTEIDLGLTYKINKSTTYAIDFGYLVPDGFNATDDPAVALGHRLMVSF